MVKIQYSTRAVAIVISVLMVIIFVFVILFVFNPSPFKYLMVFLLLPIMIIPIAGLSIWKKKAEKKIRQTAPLKYKALYNLIMERELSGLYDYRRNLHNYRRKFIDPNLSKREKRALETCFKYFPQLHLKKSELELENDIQSGDLVVITSKYILNTILAYLFGLLFLFLFVISIFGVIISYLDPAMFHSTSVGAAITLAIFTFPVSIGLLSMAIYYRFFFIILDSHGIYYKKIGKPKVILWEDVAKIEGYPRKTEKCIRIHLKSNKKIRFGEASYQFQDKFLEYYDIIRMFKHLRCVFLAFPSFPNFPRFNEFLQIGQFDTRDIISL